MKRNAFYYKKIDFPNNSRVKNYSRENNSYILQRLQYLDCLRSVLLEDLDTREEKQDKSKLTQRIRCIDNYRMDILESFLRKNIGLAFMGAKKGAAYYMYDLEECFSQALLGLLKSIYAWDCARESQFSTLAFRVMKNEIKNYIRKQRRLERLEERSFDVIVHGKGMFNMTDIVPGKELSGYDSSVANEEISMLTKCIDEFLTHREREVIKYRFGICGYDKKTLSEIGKSMELSRERIRQIQNEALEKLKKAMKNNY